jgi:putative PIN family toxin of toxin-antitoxin system
MKIVLDTNVIVSALMNANGIPARILSLMLNGKIRVLFDNRIVFEYRDVLSRKEFGFDADIISNLVDYLKNNGEFVNSNPIKIKFPDETDKKFYEVYKSGGAQYLITGNLKHFPKEDGIVGPGEFIKAIG